MDKNDEKISYIAFVKTKNDIVVASFNKNIEDLHGLFEVISLL